MSLYAPAVHRFHHCCSPSEKCRRGARPGLIPQEFHRESHLAKVMQSLVKYKIVQSCRGVKGGFSFARSPDGIMLPEIYESLEGSIMPGGCLLNHEACTPGGCLLTDLLLKIEKTLMEELRAKTVADFHIYKTAHDLPVESGKHAKREQSRQIYQVQPING